jgi:hypothetical protein
VPGVRWRLGAGLVEDATHSIHIQDKRACLPRPDPVACHPSSLPVDSVCVYFRGSGGGPQPSPCVAGEPGCARSPLWIFLAMAGVFAVSRSQHPYVRGCLFIFPPPLVGAELGHEHASQFFASAFVKQLT